MPLITRRSSTRALPRVSVGRCGLIFENCAFVSQNWSRLIYASFSEAVNHAITFVPTLLWVRTLVDQVAGCVSDWVVDYVVDGADWLVLSPAQRLSRQKSRLPTGLWI